MASALGPSSSNIPQDVPASLVYEGFDSLNLLASVGLRLFDGDRDSHASDAFGAPALNIPLK